MSSHQISHHIPAINRFLAETGYMAKRSAVKANEIIIGSGSDVVGCVTVILADNPSDHDRPTWYVGVFHATSPRDLSTSLEVKETPDLQTATHWHGMLSTVMQAIA